MRYYRDQQNRIHALDEAAPTGMLPAGCVELTQNEIQQLFARSQSQIEGEAVRQRLEEDTSTAKQYSRLKALSDMTPAQVQEWVNNNVNTMADAKDAIKTLAIAVSVLSRRL
jgi:hypothetical protein